MKLSDLTELALRNLRESFLRNSLTTVGISVGVASLVAMLSLGIGLQQMASRRLVKSGLFDTIIVSSRREMRGMGREGERNGPIPGESSLFFRILHTKTFPNPKRTPKTPSNIFHPTYLIATALTTPSFPTNPSTSDRDPHTTYPCCLLSSSYPDFV